VIVRAGSKLASIAAFRGSHVALGPKGRGTELAAKMLLGAFGLTTLDVHPEFMPYEEASRRLVRGSLDAAFMASPYPADAVAGAMRGGARLLDIVGPPVEQLRREHPFFRKMLIPDVVYEGQNRTVHTIGVDNVLLCRAGLDEDLVYRLTKVLLEALPFPSSENNSPPGVDFKRAPATPLPLHAGAARYYRERELFR
jgi:TRAP transporter TAXI family solute receptor